MPVRNSCYGEMTIAKIAMLANMTVRLKVGEMDEIYRQMKSELKRIKTMRLQGFSGRIARRLNFDYKVCYELYN